MYRKQQGFTLVEIAIVLVIIGLLLGGVLKGQELINSAKVKNLINDFRATSTFVYSYQDRFRAIPGDDAAAVAHVAASAAATTHTTGAASGATGDGRINGAWNNAATTTEEAYRFWEQVRLAGLAAGSTTIGGADYIPRNADGGVIGITGDRVLTTTVWNATFFVCSDNIQGRYARQIDATIDDGVTDTGSIRVIGVAGTASAATAPTNLATANDATLYVVCMAF